MEHAIGTKITLEVVEKKERTCEGCYFKSYGCTRPFRWVCSKNLRTDHKHILYKEVKEETR